jgi:ubiquinone/menaquinone biosynthesis C-methylase UbiE
MLVAMNQDRDFVPALGRHELTGAYDRVLAVMTRERRWRCALLSEADPQPGETILDVGCGTGTFAIQLKTASPGSRLIGVDPDKAVLEIARDKARRAGVHVEWRAGYGDALTAILPGAAADKVVSSLVLHQCPMPVKRAILAACLGALRPGGRLHMADAGRQANPLMRLLFRQVQMLDGFEHTEPNALGVLPDLMREAGFEAVSETRRIPTPTGPISLYAAVRP